MPIDEPFDVVVDAPPPPPLDPQSTALLVIDLQYLDASPDHGLALMASANSRPEVFRHRFERIEQILPNVARVADVCRRVGAAVIYVRIVTGRTDGSDGSPSLRGLHCVDGSREAQILDQIAPQPGDIVLSKSSISAFTSSPIDQTLRNLGITTLLGAGIVTNGCVELTMRDAADRGYFGVLLEDCCGANTPTLHSEALGRMDRGLLRVRSSDDVISELAPFANTARKQTTRGRIS